MPPVFLCGWQMFTGDSMNKVSTNIRNLEKLNNYEVDNNKDNVLKDTYLNNNQTKIKKENIFIIAVSARKQTTSNARINNSLKQKLKRRLLIRLQSLP